ncbi:family 1 encapsulin nanocompartment shell protein [Bacillus tianshenii]|nr:family 1 encapsulin nanocompartment shell protein [Bacillus tianshenii]
MSESPLNETQWEELDQTVINSASRQLIGRRFIDIYGPLGNGVQSVTNDIYEDSELGSLSYHGQSSEISLPKKRVNLSVPLLHKDFILYWRDLQYAEALNNPIDFSAAANAAQQCAHLEDDLIFNGSKEFDLPGLLNVKGKLSHIRNDWMTSGGAFSDIVEARNKLLKMGHTGPYTLILSPQLYALLHRVHQGTNVLEIEHVRELMTGGVLQSPMISGERGVIVDAGKQNVDLAIAQDFETVFLDDENMNYIFRVFESVVLRIKRPSAICTLEDPEKND